MKNWIKYWRNSLIDYSRMSISVKDIETDGVEIELKELTEGFTSEHVKPLLGKNDSSILIMVSPIIVKKKTTHGLKKDIKYCPYWIPCTLSKDGLVTPPTSTSLYPWFIRSVIEPNGVDQIPNISETKTIDRTLDKYEFKECTEINDYLKMCSDYFEEITGDTYSNYEPADFFTESKVLVVKGNDKHNTVKALVEGYDYVLDNKYPTNLLKKITNGESAPLKDIRPDNELYLEGFHIAQMSSEFPLSRTQRSSCALYFNKKECGEILAVNGPPGTGKTTLLQTVLANTIVESAMYGKEQMPLTVATSTNNQAITNILDSFSGVGGEDELSSRWLPDINSLGLYFVSSTSEKEAIEKGRPFINKRGEGVFSDLETEQYYDRAKKHFIERANKLVGCELNSIDKIIPLLRNKVLYNVFKQKDILNAYKEYLKVESPEKDIIELKSKLEKASDRKDFFIKIQKEFADYYKDVSVIHKILPFTKSAKFEREWINRKVFKEIDTTEIDITNTKDLNQLLVSEIDKYSEQVAKYNRILKRLGKVQKGLNSIINDFVSLKEDLDKKSFSKVKKLYSMKGDEYKDVELFEDINIKLDITHRVEAYKWAVHYWEAIYLRELKAFLDSDDKKEFSFKQHRAKLCRWAMVYPCFIATSYTLPSIAFKYGWSTPYFGIFDQMIVDEAGQVCSEVGALSFAYSKRAIVVGDTKQIEPIWTINRHVDIGNLQLVKLAKTEDDYQELDSSGLLASSGSIMKLAQNASCYKDGLDRGYSLKEHRRCLDEIVHYCEKYVYKGALVPKVGSKSSKCIQDFPSMGYLNIEGKKSKKYGSSCNFIEAETITQWICNYIEKIENHYKKEIGKVLAVVTPFSAQKLVIKNELKKAGLGKCEITVGTVHALQGAERDIILFSPVYHDPNEGYFFDASYNMLNVAVSRAKHNFFVFGKMRIFDPMVTSPSGDLAKVLFSSEENELGEFHYSKSEVFKKVDNHKDNRISTLDKHRRTLKKVIKNSTERLVIISPFISIHAIKEDSLIELFETAISRGVDITVLTDQNLDAPRGKIKPSSEEGRSALKNVGVNLKIIKGIHQKSILMDNRVLIEGSFNWLSAVRDEDSPYYRKEVSYIITKDVDTNLSSYISEIEEELLVKA